ncbi:MAG: two-component regulator propeller domain-containing protein [Flavobacteriaceae bacterium]
MSLHKVLYATVFLFPLWSLYAFQTIKFDHINITDGLSNNSVTAIEKDDLGYMWFGTYNGLNKYDGLEIKGYTMKGDKTGLPDNHITSLYNDSRGILWVGTRNGGLVKYNQELDNFIQVNLLTEKGKETIEIRAITEDGNGDLWIGTISHGLFRVDHNRGVMGHYSTNSKSKPRLVSNNITSLYFDTQNGKLVVGSKSPFIELITTNEEVISYSKFSLISKEDPVYPKKIITDKDQNLWVATYKKGLFRVDKGSSNVLHWDTQNSTLSHNVLFNMLYRPEENSIWLATDGGGIQNYDIVKNTFSSVVSSEDPESLSSNSVLSFYKDELATTWIGTQYGGVNIYDILFRQYNTINVFDGLTNNRVKCFLKYDEQSVYIGTDGGGLSRYDKATNVVHKIDIGIVNLNINSLFKKANGSILIGAYGNGLFEYNPRTQSVKSLLPKNFVENNSTEIFIQDALEIKDTIVFGTPYGLYYIPIKGELYRIELSNPDAPLDDYQLNSIKCLAKNGTTIWAGTKAGFVEVLLEEKLKVNYFKIMSSGQGLTPQSENIINRIKVLDKKIMLCSDRGIKLFDINSREISMFEISDDLDESMILDIAVDENDYWICTNDNGLVKFHAENRTTEFITDDNGLQDNSLNAILLTSENKIFVGGNNGFNHFYLNNIKKNKVKPPVHFTDFKLFNKSVDFTLDKGLIDKHISKYKSLTLKSNQNDVSFDFIALNYNSPYNNMYAYIMENYDQGWNYVGNKTIATYTNLPPGDFVLKVKASNNDGLWTSEDLRMEIKVLPPWYKTFWAYFGYIALILLLLFAFYKILLNWTKLNHKLEIETLEKEKTESLIRERVEFFTNISHEFKTPLSLILAPIDNLIENGGGAIEVYKLIRQNANRLLRLINQLMDFRKNETGNLSRNPEVFEIKEFMNDVIGSFDILANQRELLFSHELSAFTKIETDKDKLDKILFNILSNAFRACRKGDSIKVSSRIYLNNQNYFLETVIKDNGIGIAQDHLSKIFNRFYQVEQNPGSTGVGLSLVKAYVDLLNGEILVESRKGEGTSFRITLPVIVPDKPEIDVRVIREINPDANEVVEIEIKNMNVKSKKILIVEDEFEILTYLSRILGEDYTIIKAADGVEGLERTLVSWPDLIISDVMMPRMSGFELCTAIKEDVRTNHIPIILLTAMSSEEKTIEGTKFGADLYIHKPFNINLLQEQVRTLFSNIEKRKDSYRATISHKNEHKTKEDAQDPFVEKVTKIILEHLTDMAFNVADLSSKLAMHRTNLHHKIKTLTGLTPSEFIRSVRLAEALSKLRENSLNVSEIAYTVGFNTPAYFTKCFKRQYGCLPGEYRKYFESLPPSES